MTVTYTDQEELSIEQQALAVEKIKLDRQLITGAILNQGPDLGRWWHTIEFSLVLGGNQASISAELQDGPERLWAFVSYTVDEESLYWRVRTLFEFDEDACCHGEWSIDRGCISLDAPVDQHRIARLMTCDETIELLEASCLYELQKNARELLLKEVS
jgi:hypothetical protein